jgi:uncharacterized protein YjaZ
MGVINTKKWIMEDGTKPVILCEKLTNYFKGVTSKEIYEHLASHGMYRTSIFQRGMEFEPFIKSDYWTVVRSLYKDIRKKWSGPDVPIFIFPVNQRNPQIMKDFNGKSGLAYSDKLFLFLSPDMQINEIKALLTHEYHHVCRLHFIKKKEQDMTLIDSIILEGLAEQAVKSYCGIEYTARWTTKYSKEQLDKWWHELVAPYRDTKKNDPIYQELLYGLKGHPKMLGYCVGFYLIDLCLLDHKYSLRLLEKLPSHKIIEIATKE